ncbi:hypothetical protein V6N13_036001 [Hibiscus sabdariffa]
MSFSQNPNVEEVVPANGLAVGFKGGRPPDEVVVVDRVNILERSGSSVPEVVQPLQKRGRNLEEAMLIDDESGQVAPDGVVLVGDGSQVQAAADGLSAPSIPSFKDKLVGSKGALDPVVARSFKLLSATPPPLPHLGEDVLGWRWDAKREFRGCRLATPPAAIAIAVAEEKCHRRVGFEPAVVDIEGSGSVDGSGLAVMD